MRVEGGSPGCGFTCYRLGASYVCQKTVMHKCTKTLWGRIGSGLSRLLTEAHLENIIGEKKCGSKAQK